MMEAAPGTSPAATCSTRRARHAIVGVRMTAEREVEVKIEAVRRGLSVAALFEELWQAYMQGRPK